MTNALSIKERIAAADMIVASQPSDIEVDRQLLGLDHSAIAPELGLGIIQTLRHSDAPDLGSVMLEQLGSMTPTIREGAIELMLSRPAMAAELLTAVESGTIKFSELSLIQKQRLSEYPDGKLRDRAKSLLATGQENVSSDRKEVVAQFADLANEQGNAVNGKAVFTKNCAVCHRYQGEGTTVGPDLTGMGVHGKQQLLVHISGSQPRRRRQLSGLHRCDSRMAACSTACSPANRRRASNSSTAKAKRHAILREEIDELTRTGKSLMPDGFEKQLSRAELSDVLEFLTQRSKFVPLDLRRVATISSVSGMFQTPGSDVERLVFDDWGTKTFAGVPFYPLDPQGGRVRNAIMLHGDLGDGRAQDAAIGSIALRHCRQSHSFSQRRERMGIPLDKGRQRIDDRTPALRRRRRQKTTRS